MSVLVPDFRVDDGDGFSVPFSTRLAMVEDEIMELLWEDGRLLVRRQRPPETRAAIPAGCGEFRDGECQQHQRLFMQEDEVGSWLHYPFDVFDRGGFGSDLPHSPTPCVTSSSDADCDFGTGDSGEVTTESGASEVSTGVPKAAMGESSPSISNEHTAMQQNVTTPPARSGAVRGDMRMETTNGSAVDAPPGGGATTGTGRLAQTPAASQPRMQPEKRKREGREAGEGERLSDEKDVPSESANAEKRVDKSTPAKRCCCADVHNLSERRHRDRISRKMRALQELLPWCTKVDRASLLDEAIEYLKSLQLQVQIMSMGCGVVPVVFPGVQAYMPCMNMGTATDAGMNRPMMLFPNILASSMMQLSANGAHLGPGFPISTFSMQQEASNQFKTPSLNHLDPTLSSQMIQNLSQQFPENASSFQQQLGLHYMQQLPQ